MARLGAVQTIMDPKFRQEKGETMFYNEGLRKHYAAAFKAKVGQELL